MKVLIYFVIILTFLSISCSDEIINNYQEEVPAESGPPDLNVIYTSYSLHTLHSDHISTDLPPGYNYIINLDVKLDKPENRNQINKLIIINTEGYGWEFYSDVLEKSYSDTLKGYIIKNLIYDFPSNIFSQNYKIKIYSAKNIPAADYDFILKTNFMSPPSSNNIWIDQNELQVSIENYNDVTFKNGEVIWLNEDKEEIGKMDFTYSSLEDYIIDISNVPPDAVYFYMNIYNNNNEISYECKSSVELISERFPSNVQIFRINDFENLSFNQYNDKIFFSDYVNKKISIYDFESMNLIDEITLNNNNEYLLTYSEDEKIYLAAEDGRIYTVSSNGNLTLTADVNSEISSIIIIDNFIFAGITDYGSSSLNGFARVNLEDNSINMYTNDFYYGAINFLIYNEANNIVYGITSFSTIYRIKLDPSDKTVESVSIKSINNPSSSAMLSSDGTKLLTSNGYIYTCSSSNRNDLTYLGNISNSYDYFKFASDGNGLLGLQLDSLSGGYLDIYSLSSLSIVNSITDFYGKPLAFFSNGDIIKILTYDSKTDQYYSESFSYSGLLSKKNSIDFAKNSFYEMKKLF